VVKCCADVVYVGYYGRRARAFREVGNKKLPNSLLAEPGVELVFRGKPTLKMFDTSDVVPNRSRRMPAVREVFGDIREASRRVEAEKTR
jgi:hypothetical protein